MGIFSGEYSLLDLLLFPTGIFVVALTCLNVPYLLPALALTFLALTLYSLGFSLSPSSIARSLLLSVLHVFFREVGTRGSHKIPASGPVLFACAPHVNQFVDPICVMTITDRFVHFLCAAWTMRQPLFGDIARALQAIPVERAMDIAQKGEGKVTLVGKQVTGDAQTKFTQYAPGWSFLIKEEQMTIESMHDDRSMTLSHTLDRGDVTEPSSYYCAPRIDQGEVFKHVWDSLGHGEAVGIFPEGGSHDQSAFLPFKAGVAIMALGACVKYDGLPLKIIPVGLNYFQGHKFRSRVYLDIGDPITPTGAQIDGYKSGGDAKKAAINELLEQVHASLKLVTVTAPSYQLLHLLWAVRRLYTPSGITLSVNQKLELTRRFEQYYDRMKDLPIAQSLQQRVEVYNNSLMALGLRDYQIKIANETRHQVWPLLLQRVVLLLAMFVAALPGAILNAPILVMSKLVSTKKAREAVSESTVKLEGRDVIATWKVMVACGMLPLCLIAYPIVGALVGHHYFPYISRLRFGFAVSLLQIPFMYASVRFSEVGWRILTSLKPLWLAFTGHAGIQQLKAERESLAAAIKLMIDEYGPKLWKDGKFEQERLIHASSLINKEWNRKQVATDQECDDEDSSVDYTDTSKTTSVTNEDEEFRKSH